MCATTVVGITIGAVKLLVDLDFKSFRTDWRPWPIDLLILLNSLEYQVIQIIGWLVGLSNSNWLQS